QPRMHRLPAHPPVSRHLRHRPTVAEDRYDRLVPLLSHAQLLHAQECQASAETGVRHQPKLCKASAEHVLSCISRTRTRLKMPSAGLEPATPALGRRRSGPLSYEGMLSAARHREVIIDIR